MINLHEDTEQVLVIVDELQIKRAVKAKDLCSFIYNFKEYLRREWKRIENIENPTEFDTYYDQAVDKIMEEYNTRLAEDGIDLDELWS